MSYEKYPLVDKVTPLDMGLFRHLEQGIINVLDESKELLGEKLLLNADTEFGAASSGLWYPYKNAVASVEDDHVKVVCDGSTSYQGIRMAPPDIEVGKKVTLSFWYKKDSAYASPGTSKIGLTNSTDYTVTMTDEWQLFEKEFEFPGTWDRIQISYASSATEGIFYMKDFSIIDNSIKTVRERIEMLESSVGHPLAGKKIAVIGDSISTGPCGNTPYWTVLDVDVGKTIQSYVTYYDVFKGSGAATGKTIGGVTLTEDMIGTLQEFTPVADDVGKEIGQAVTYYADASIVWSSVLCELTGATQVANSSWSGSSMVSAQETDITKKGSYAWNDYTIGRCKDRDANGNDITPDVIFIYRGTNDFSKTSAVLDDVDLMDSGIPKTDVLEGDKYSYKTAYYLTIQKLRQAYPLAIIVCCTLNNFKRLNRAVFPVHNGVYTIPEMNNAIREIANMMGCHVVEFDKDGITYENINHGDGYVKDGDDIPTHPNEAGHAVMAQRAYQDTKLLNFL